MAAGRHHFRIEQGTAWSERLRYGHKPATPGGAKTYENLTGWTAKLHARVKEGDPDPPVIHLNTNGAATPTPDAVITLDANGYITWALSAAKTAALALSVLQYDLLLDPPTGDPIRLLEGQIEISKAVTTP